jgi:hypothetical protein
MLAKSRSIQLPSAKLELEVIVPRREVQPQLLIVRGEKLQLERVVVVHDHVIHIASTSPCGW